MKKVILSLGASVLLLASCGTDTAKYDAAADKICSCMETKTAEQAAEESEFSIDMTDLNFALCALDVATDVDPFADEMGTAIEKKCSQWKKAHEEYQKVK